MNWKWYVIFDIFVTKEEGSWHLDGSNWHLQRLAAPMYEKSLLCKPSLHLDYCWDRPKTQ